MRREYSVSRTRIATRMLLFLPLHLLPLRGGVAPGRAEWWLWWQSTVTAAAAAAASSFVMIPVAELEKVVEGRG